MSRGVSTLTDVSLIFENLRTASIHTHAVDSAPIGAFLKASGKLFQQLDRSDAVQAEFSLRLWVLRSTITFTLLPFDAVELNLRSKLDDLSTLSFGLPDTTQLVGLLARALEELLEVGVNPKREWMTALVQQERDDNESPRIALFHALASGITPGWPAEALNELALHFSSVKMVGSRRELRSAVFERIILPCGCQNASTLVLGDIFHSGRAKRIDVLLYPGERLRIPRRIALPETPLFAGRLYQTVMDHESHSAPIDNWVNEEFWQSIHGAARTNGVNRVRAHYTLFCDGTGAFLCSDRRALVLPEMEGVSVDSDLRLVRVEDVCEGDLIVLRAGSSGALLDEESDEIMSGMTDQSLVDDATCWKPALEALLLTHSYAEVAQALRDRGVAASAASVKHWAGIEALGPGNEGVLEALISLLGEKGKLTPDQDWKAYAAAVWVKLRELRGVRQKAGNAIRQDLIDALRSQFANSNIKLADRTVVHLDGGGAAKLLILRVSSVDQVPAFVQPARLLQIDDLRENKWLG